MTGTEPIFLLAGALAAWLYRVVTDKRVQEVERERDAAADAHRAVLRDKGDEHAAEVKSLREEIVELEAECFRLRRELAADHGLSSSGVGPAAPDTEIDP